ncbi:TPA: alpha amylase N-terminal ig-like domain-containing protein [Streptococcus pneumoniae]|nr:alpha amylase N-terminal ig-like domain-containing protein [Streptococcus pneumoniae]HEU5561618.1 alpha amylase N-terminal ig-like domain-containing protein [Streptococcus pneumoniae]
MNTLGDKLMELSAIYHRPESEYAYLYKDKKLHIRIRTKKGDIESINLHYGGPFYLYGGVLSGYKRNGQDNFWYLI